MCIIAAKPAGVEMPAYKYIHNMFANNDDGAGLMYADNGKVYIEKGFMDELSFTKRLYELAETYDMTKLPLVMHFRITTHGGTKPENCHPFPVTDSKGMLKKLKCRTDVGVAHNGIIDITPRDKTISDTMEYIASQMAPLKRAVPNFYKNKDLLEMIYNAIDSKMVIMNGKGEMFFIGNFTDEDGMKYSNFSYAYDRMSFRDFPCNYLGYGDSPFYEGVEYIEMPVMYLDEGKGEYVKDRYGKLFCEDAAIDEDENVYIFDPELGMFIPALGLTAYNSEGFPLRYNADSYNVTTELIAAGDYYA